MKTQSDIIWITIVNNESLNIRFVLDWYTLVVSLHKYGIFPFLTNTISMKNRFIIYINVCSMPYMCQWLTSLCCQTDLLSPEHRNKQGAVDHLIVAHKRCGTKWNNNADIGRNLWTFWWWWINLPCKCCQSSFKSTNNLHLMFDINGFKLDRTVKII